MHRSVAAQMALGLGRFFGQDMTHEGMTGFESAASGFPKALRGAPVGFKLRHVT
jgi:hypothetical protein